MARLTMIMIKLWYGCGVRFRKSSALIIQQIESVDSPGKRDLPSVAERIKFYHQRTLSRQICLPRTQADFFAQQRK